MQCAEFTLGAGDVLACRSAAAVLGLDAGRMRCTEFQGVVDSLMLRTIRFNNRHQFWNEAIIVLVVFCITPLPTWDCCILGSVLDLPGDGKERRRLLLCCFGTL